MDDSLVHKISIETTCKSKARLFWGRVKTKKFLLGEHYDIKLKLKNVGEKDFPGGKALIRIIYASPQHHSFGFSILPIKVQNDILIELPSRAALGKRYASFFGKIIANDGEEVKIIRYGQELPEDASFYDIFIETRAEIYGKILAILTILSFILSLILIFK